MTFSEVSFHKAKNCVGNVWLEETTQQKSRKRNPEAFTEIQTLSSSSCHFCTINTKVTCTQDSESELWHYKFSNRVIDGHIQRQNNTD